MTRKTVVAGPMSAAPLLLMAATAASAGARYRARSATAVHRRGAMHRRGAAHRRAPGARSFHALLAAALLLAAAPAPGQVPNPDLWVTNGEVRAIAPHGNTIYIGGEFTIVGPNTGGGAKLNLTDGRIVPPLRKIEHPDWSDGGGSVTAAVPDGSGGWYIGGLFTSVGGAPRSNLARILADGSVSAWNPGVNGQVLALAVSADGNTIYAGGAFNQIGGATRGGLAALSASTGLATTWNPNPNYVVETLAVSGTTLYVGGQFTMISGQTRSRIAAYSTSTGDLTSWNPSAIGGNVLTIAVSGSTVYAGGGFTSIGGQARNRIAALSASTGNATSWNPNALLGDVETIAVGGTVVYAGGNFTSIGGQARNRIAALSPSTGNATAWNPNADNWVFALAVSGSTVYAGGYFRSIGGQDRRNIAAIDAVTGTATAWNPTPGGGSGRVSVLSVSGSAIYAGGDFHMIGGYVRNYLAAFDASTGAATGWNPNANTYVDDLAVDAGKVYVGGSFTSIGGYVRNYLAALDAVTGIPTPWNPDCNSRVKALHVQGNSVFVGGSFTSISGWTRHNVAELDATTGLPTAWDPDLRFCSYWCTPCDVYCLVPGLFVAGCFTHIGGVPRFRLAQLSHPSPGVTLWDPLGDPLGPNWNRVVRALLRNGSTLYVGGEFDSIGGRARNNIAAFDVLTGSATDWNPDANGRVLTFSVLGSTVYVGGHFTSIGGQPRRFLAALDATTGLATPWAPDVDGGVHEMAASGSALYIGGWFFRIGGESRNFFAGFTVPTTSVGGDPAGMPRLALTPPHPNPSVGPASLRFSLPRAASVRLEVFDMHGRRVRTLARGELPAGEHARAWDGTDDQGRPLGPGVYFGRLTAGRESATTKVIRLE